MRVNIDYVPVIRENDNLVRLEHIEIEKPLALLSNLKEMMEDKCHSILDLQSIMYNHYSKDERASIRFLSPNSYYSTYISAVDFPNYYTIDEYTEFVQNTKEDVIKKHTTNLKQIREKEGEAKYEEMVKHYLESELDIKKRNYYNKCIRFIDAHSYQATINKCKADSCIKMHSVEEDGWCHYKHVINDDIAISVSTNFGYGNSTYFHLSLNYKGIEILPYSFIVKYYHAKMRDICHCTRNYYAMADNWNLALSFVERVVNLAATDTEKFCNEFIKDEIDTLLVGLEKAVRLPHVSLESLITAADDDPRETYLGVKNIDSYEASWYFAYPEDMSIAFMAEKIMNANYILSNLCSLSKVYPVATEAIEKLKEYIYEARPKIQASHSKNTLRISACAIARDQLKKEIEALKDKEAEYDKTIDAIYEEQKATRFRSDVKKEYEKNNAEYRQIKEDINDKEEQFRKLGSETYVRQRFVDRLENCISAISE